MATMSSYEYQHNQLVEELLTINQRDLGWEWIAAQFNEPVPADDLYTHKGFGTNVLPDPTWEGFSERDEGDRRSLVPSKIPGYAVIKYLDGRCLIPATPNNIRRLDTMKTRNIILQKADKEAGIEELSTTRPPLYTRILELPPGVRQNNRQTEPALA